MTFMQSDPSEPPLIAPARQALQTLKRVTWLSKKLLAPAAYRALTWSLAAVVLIGLNPAATAQAADGGLTADTPSLADFTFDSYEDITPDEVEATIQENGFAAKPIVVSTEMGRPEKELLARQAQQRKQAEAAAAKTRAAQLAQARRPKITPATSTVVSSVSSAGNSYAYGYCTWWAKSQRPDLPNQLGNGGAWLRSAQSLGLATGRAPKPGAIVVTSESSLGHVGYVESVEGDQMVVSDMNMIGRGKISKRRMSASAAVIKGFIY